MGKITPAVLEKTIASRENFPRKPAYLIFGVDQRRVADLAGRLKNRIVADMGEESYFRYMALSDPRRPQAGEGVPAGEVIAQLNTIAMFGGGKIAFVGPLPGIAQAWQKEFADYAASPNETSTLIIAVSPSKEDRKGIAGMETSALAKMIEKGGGDVVKVAPPSPAEVTKWAVDRFARKGVTIPKEVAATIVDLSDNDSDRVAGEIDKLVAYVGDANAVTADDVEATVGDHKQKSIFNSLDDLRRRNLPASIEALTSLTEQNVPSQQILKMVGTELLRLWGVLDGRRSKLDNKEIAARMGVPDFMLKETVAAAGRWDENRVRRGLAEVMAATLDPMRTGLPGDTSLTRLTTRLCGD